MFPRVKQVRHLGEYHLELSFTDDTKGELDFKERVVGRGGVFAPLENIDFFQQVKVDPESGTIDCPNEVDFCPDVLYSLVTGKPLQARRQVRKHESLTRVHRPRRALVAGRRSG